MIRSMRGRLLLGTIVGSSLVLLAAGAALYNSTSARLWAEFDATMFARARMLASLVEREDREFELEIDYRTSPEFDRSPRPEYFQIWAGDGTVVARSRSLGEQELGRPRQAAAQSVSLPDGRSGRLAGITTYPREESTNRESRQAGAPAQSQITVVVARDTADLERTLAGLKGLLICLGLLTIGLSAGVLALVVWRGLRPLDSLAAQIANLSPDSTAARVELPNAPAELMPVVEKMNLLLGRVGATIERERSFAADVAHELRTPLSGLRSTLEVVLSRSREPAEYQTSMAECLRITAHMQAMTNNLLSLARMEAGHITLDRQPTPLKGLLEGCWGPFEERAREKSVQVVWQGDASITVATDREQLRQVISNLLDNAVSYVNTRGQIAITAHSTGNTAQIQIMNTGSSVTSEQAEQAFERFWRGDASREETGLHCGLGLSLARRAMQLLGGTIRAESKPGGSFSIIMTLPS